MPLVAEPHAHHVLFQVELLGDGGDLLGRGPRLNGEVGLERALLRRRDGCALALFVAAAEDLGLGHLLALRPLGLLEPRFEDGLQGHHVVMRERERLEATDCALAQAPDTGYLEVSERGAHIRLSHAELNATLLEALGERLELAGVWLGVSGRDAGAGEGGVRGQGVVRVVHVDGLRVRVVMVVRVVDGRGHVRVRVRCARGHVRGGRHAAERDGWGEVLEQVALQALSRLVVVVRVVCVMVRCEHGRVVQVRRGGRRGACHARHRGHGVVRGVWLERVALLGHDVHRGQSLGSLQQRLIETGEDVSLQLRTERRRAKIRTYNT